MSLRLPGWLPAAVIISLVVACADGDASARVTDSAAMPSVPAPVAVDSVKTDSLPAASEPEVAGASVPPAEPVDSTTASDTAPPAATVQDTTKPKPKRGRLGASAGQMHMAFRDAGSELDSLWPVKTDPPLPGSILPAKRIIAFYGNPLSKRMGILGEFEPEEMLLKLDTEVMEWSRLDPEHPVQPALHLIAMVADPHPGPSGKYRTRMDSAFIEKVYGWAQNRKALLFVDLQVGQSTLQHELPWIEKFLIRPDVHLGIDPEFAMKKGGIPGQRIGTFDAAEINYAIRFLADLVTKHNLPPKILVVHRFTRGGVTNYDKIELDPRVQFVMHMDGFGAPWLKRDTYWRDIKSQPVQFAGWKQFTKTRNDNPPTPREEILRLWPVPLYIQIH
jgi:hypothetical protein